MLQMEKFVRDLYKVQAAYGGVNTVRAGVRGRISSGEVRGNSIEACGSEVVVGDARRGEEEKRKERERPREVTRSGDKDRDAEGKRGECVLETKTK